MLSRTLYREFEVLIHLCTAFRDNPAITFLLCDVCRQKTKLQLLSRPLNRTAIRLIDVMPDEFEYEWPSFCGRMLKIPIAPDTSRRRHFRMRKRSRPGSWQ